MRKHQFYKENCNCLRRASYYKCKFCGTVEYQSSKELKALTKRAAECTSECAPQVKGQEKLKSALGGTIDCLAPDWETYGKDNEGKTCETC